MERYFFCYDQNLYNFLRHKKGIWYITRAVHPESRKLFYLFEKTNEVKAAIDEYFERIDES